MQANLDGFEIFVCEFEELLKSSNFKETRKRNMILPVSIVFIRTTHMILNKDRKELMKITHNKLSIDQLVVRLSYQDSLLVTNSINFQIEQLKLDKTPGTSPLRNKGGSPERTKSITEFAPTQSFAFIPATQEEKSKQGFFTKLEKKSDVEEETKVDEIISPTKHLINFEAPDIISPVKKTNDDKKTEIIIIQDSEAEMNDEDWEPDHEEYNLISKGIQIVSIF